MGRMTLVGFGLSAAGIGLFVAVFVLLVASFLSQVADLEFLAWAEGAEGLAARLFWVLCLVLVLRHLMVWLAGRR